ncbi:MAG: hypothetical protein AABX29_03055 [Nanoarchaeota archaeon]
MSDESELLHEDGRGPKQHHLKPRVDNTIGPGPISLYGLHTEEVLNAQEIDESTGEFKITALPADQYLEAITEAATNGNPLSKATIEFILEIARRKGLMNENSPLSYLLGLEPLSPKRGGLTPNVLYTH